MAIGLQVIFFQVFGITKKIRSIEFLHEDWKSLEIAGTKGASALHTRQQQVAGGLQTMRLPSDAVRAGVTGFAALAAAVRRAGGRFAFLKRPPVFPPEEVSAYTGVDEIPGE